MERQYCTFYLDHYFCGIRVEEIQEILRYQDMTPVPLSPTIIEGLINLRGQIVTAINLRSRLKLPPLSEGDAQPTNVITFTTDGAVSFLVDRIGDVVTLDEDDAETPPPTLRPPAAEVIESVYQLNDRLLVILDPNRCADAPPTTHAQPHSDAA